MSSNQTSKQPPNRTIKNLKALVVASALLFGSLAGAPESQAQGPSEAETISFLEQMVDQVSYQTEKESPDHIAWNYKLEFPGHNVKIRFSFCLGCSFQDIAKLTDLAEIRVQGNAIRFVCRERKESIDRELTTSRSDGAKERRSETQIGLRPGHQDIQDRIVKALLHLAQLRGVNLVDGTANKDLFK
jgi:hypothetical protein